MPAPPSPPPSTAWPPGIRGRLMLTMAEVAARRGYADTRVQHVLEQAGISRRTFYVHFDNRDDCFLATYDAIVVDVEEALSAERPTVRALIDGLLAYFARWPAHARMLLTEPFSAGPPGVERHERMVTLVAARLDECEPWQPGECAELQRDELAQATVGAMLRIIQRRLLNSESDSVAGLTPMLVALATRVRVAA